MTTLTWAKDPNDEEDTVGMSGEIEVARIRQSSSGRWRWEVANFPGIACHRDERSGWVQEEDAAMAVCQMLWDSWLQQAGLK